MLDIPLRNLYDLASNIAVPIIVMLIVLVGLGILASRTNYRILEEPLMRHTINALMIIIFIACASVLIIMADIVPTYHKAIKHGMMDDSITVEQARYNIDHTPVETDISNMDLHGKLIVYYRFDCEDCHALYEPIAQYLTDYDIAWVSTRTEQGKELMKRCPCESVPSLLCITDNEFVIMPLCDKTTDGTTVLNTKNADSVLNVYNSYLQQKNLPLKERSIVP